MKFFPASFHPPPENSPRGETSRTNCVRFFQYGKSVKRGLGSFVGIVALCFLFAKSASGATYYVDYASGSDSNSGTSKSTAWRHQPYMKGWTGQYTHSTGDQFIFKGGVTWPSACFPLNVLNGGSGSTNDYYGVDETWFNGSAWTMPLFDGQYVAPEMFVLDAISGNITIDGLELAHIRCTSNYGPGLIDGGSPANVLIKNCHLHGWRVSTSTDDAHGGVIFNLGGPGIWTVVIDSCEIENSENLSAWNGVCVREVGVIRNSKIHDNSSAVLFCLDFDHSELYNIAYRYQTGIDTGSFDSNYHLNGIFLDPSTLNQTLGYIRNSYLHDVGGGANLAYPNPEGASIYVYNNVMYGHMSDQLAIEVDPYNFGKGGSVGKCYVYNNTIVNFNTSVSAVHVVNRNASPLLNTLVIQNNHIIGGQLTDGGLGTVTSITQSNNLLQTTAQAASTGYILKNRYAPTTAKNPSVGVGTNAPSNIFSTDILGRVRPQGCCWDVGAYQFIAAPAPPTNLRIIRP